MIKVEKIDVWGFEAAVRGMRNPLNSWEKSDSYYGCNLRLAGKCDNCMTTPNCCDLMYRYYVIGNNDLTLMQKLFKGGTEHRKFMRQIFVSMDITAPLYWWKEYDTYKVGTVANSCSTMHKIHAKEFTLDDFSVEHLDGWSLEHFKGTLDLLNKYRYDFIETKDKDYWWQMIQLLPSSYNQRRTITMNYENVVSMIKQRENHKLDEWRSFVKLLNELPYIKEIMGIA